MPSASSESTTQYQRRFTDKQEWLDYPFKADPRFTLTLLARIKSPREAFVHRLPGELLCQIFEYYVPQDSEVNLVRRRHAIGSLRAPLLLSAVCSKWRRSATSFPRIWSRTDLSDVHPGLAELFVGRAGSTAPQPFFFTSPSMTHFGEHLKILCSNLGAFRVVNLCLSHEEPPSEEDTQDSFPQSSDEHDEEIDDGPEEWEDDVAEPGLANPQEYSLDLDDLFQDLAIEDDDGSSDDLGSDSSSTSSLSYAESRSSEPLWYLSEAEAEKGLYLENSCRTLPPLKDLDTSPARNLEELDILIERYDEEDKVRWINTLIRAAPNLHSLSFIAPTLSGVNIPLWHNLTKINVSTRQGLNVLDILNIIKAVSAGLSEFTAHIAEFPIPPTPMEPSTLPILVLPVLHKLDIHGMRPVPALCFIYQQIESAPHLDELIISRPEFWNHEEFVRLLTILPRPLKTLTFAMGCVNPRHMPDYLRHPNVANSLRRLVLEDQPYDRYQHGRRLMNDRFIDMLGYTDANGAVRTAGGIVVPNLEELEMISCIQTEDGTLANMVEGRVYLPTLDDPNLSLPAGCKRLKSLVVMMSPNRSPPYRHMQDWHRIQKMHREDPDLLSMFEWRTAINQGDGTVDKIVYVEPTSQHDGHFSTVTTDKVWFSPWP